LFDSTKIITLPGTLGFTDRLRLAGTGLSTYDKTTFYRMLAQLGTDSAPDPKLDVNYVNVNALGEIVPGMETNMIPWRALQFFTNSADRLLRAQFRSVALTNIPVYDTNGLFLSPAVHRLLQLAANIYESTTNGPYPSMYRPYLSRLPGPGTNIII